MVKFAATVKSKILGPPVIEPDPTAALVPTLPGKLSLSSCRTTSTVMRSPKRGG